MKKLATALIKKRNQLKKSLEDIAQESKIDINILKNIEQAKIEFFEDSLFYLPYYLKSYANLLGVDYRLYQAEISATIEAFKLNNQEKINYNLNQDLNEQSKKMDFKKISLIIISSLIVLVLILSIVVIGKILFKTPRISEKINLPSKDIVIEEKQLEPELIEKNIQLEYLDSNRFKLQIENANEFKIKFDKDSWMLFSDEKAEIKELKSTVYRQGQEISISVIKYPKLFIKTGYADGLIFELDGKEVRFDKFKDVYKNSVYSFWLEIESLEVK